jgi:hypothetical protein
LFGQIFLTYPLHICQTFRVHSHSPLSHRNCQFYGFSIYSKFPLINKHWHLLHLQHHHHHHHPPHWTPDFGT